MSMSRKTISGRLARRDVDAPRRRRWPRPARSPPTSSSVVAISLRMNGSSSTIRTERTSEPTRSRLGCARGPRRGSRRAPRPRAGSNWVPAPRAIAARASASGDARPVGPVGGDRVERVGHREDARGERDLLARPGRRGSRRRPSARGGGARSARPRRGTSICAHDLAADHRVAAHQAAAPPSPSGSGLCRIAVGDRDLADVVQQEAELDLGVVGQLGVDPRAPARARRRPRARRACPCRRRAPRPRWSARARWPRRRRAAPPRASRSALKVSRRSAA